MQAISLLVAQIKSRCSGEKRYHGGVTVGRQGRTDSDGKRAIIFGPCRSAARRAVPKRRRPPGRLGYSAIGGATRGADGRCQRRYEALSRAKG